MRQSQFLIRFLVFCCVALDPSGGGTGLAIGVTIGLTIGLTVAWINSMARKNLSDDDD